MCNEAYRKHELAKLAGDLARMHVPLHYPEGMPNFAPLDGFKITERVEIVRPGAANPNQAEMVTRRWSWPAPTGRPVYNFRSDGRSIAHGSRCLIPVDGFFEFTDPPPAVPVGESGLFGDAPAPKAPRGKKPPKSKWAFTLAGHDWFAIAGIWRSDPQVGEAWAMLTCPPGEDIAPYHDRQVVVLSPADCARWLDPATLAADLCRPLPPGSLSARQVR
jgi:putative SOS response-associated peptidase YedK